MPQKGAAETGIRHARKAISAHASYWANNAVMAVDVEALLTLTY